MATAKRKKRDPSASDYLGALKDVFFVNPRNSPGVTLGRAAYDYLSNATPQSVAQDIRSGVQDAKNWAVRESRQLQKAPIRRTLQLMKSGYVDPLLEPFRVFQQSAEARAGGDEGTAQRLAATMPLAVLGAVNPELKGAGKLATRAAERGALSAAEKRAAKSMAVKALPAPPKPLALPAPGPGLPPQASKPRGGQFYPDATLGPKDAQAAGYKLENFTDRNGVDRYVVVTPEGEAVNRYHASTPEGGWELANAHFKTNRNLTQANLSPEAAARDARETYSLTPYVNENNAPQAKLGDWLERALAKYYKTDFGAPNDPLLSLAERGLHYDPEMTPERWQRTVNENLMEDPIGFFTVPRHESEIKAQFAGEPQRFSFLGSYDPMGQGALMQAAPWLRKQPVTDMLYGIKGGLDLGHFTDEMQNALRARETGLPLDLAVRPESLDRMTFAQAAEHVGKINQFRAKEMERAALSALDSPAVWPYKSYSENNPRGLRWVELKAPENVENLLDDADRERFSLAAKEGRLDPQDKETILRVRAQRALEDALKYEGDTMGHCVGGYCPDVMSGRSRIFSLRDAKGEPHVTVETRPGSPSELYQGELAAMRERGQMGNWIDWLREKNREQGFVAPKNGFDLINEWRASQGLEPVDVQIPDDIIQIKGKQNRAPKDDYLPFVQDFVKSQKWGNIGDIENTGLVQLPDGRYITQQQWKEGLGSVVSPWRDPGQYDERYLNNLSKAEWEYMAPYFEGFAIGGRVERDRCFCRHPMAAK